MSDESSLPEDPAAWPDDPHQLLGVPRNTNRKQLRRAYHALLKRYKPEQAPEQFRRLREAYEQLLRYVEFQEQFGAIVEETPASTPVDERSDGNGELSNEVRMAVEVDDPAQVWNVGIDGDLHVLYRRLVEFVPRQRTNAELYARLFWLLRVMPELEPQRTATEWLIEGLCEASATPGPLPELYRRATDAYSELALSDHAVRLFKIQPVPPWLAHATEPRWRNARQAGRSELIIADVELLRRSFGLNDDPQTQLTLLASAIKELWMVSSAPAEQAAQKLLIQLEQHHGTDPRFYSQLAYLDQHRLYMNAWLEADRARVYEGLLDLLHGAENHDRERLRPALLRWLAIKTPRQVYHLLTLLANGSPLLFEQFGSVIGLAEAYSPEAVETDWPADVLQAAVRDFLEIHLSISNEREFFSELLTFCLQNALSPARVAEVIADQRETWLAIDDLDKAIHVNYPLQWTYTAYRLLWG